jgi:hypothetical protein
MGIRPHIKLAIQAFGRRLNALKNAKVTGTHTDKPLWPRLICPSCNFGLEAAAIVGIIERYVVDNVTTISQFTRKMAHCRKEKSEANFVLGNIGCFFLDFHHQHGVRGSVKAIKGRRTSVKLITEYQNQITDFFFIFFTHFFTSLSELRNSNKMITEAERFYRKFDNSTGGAFTQSHWFNFKMKQNLLKINGTITW